MNTNIKKIIVFGALAALIGGRCWGANPSWQLIEAAIGNRVDRVKELLEAGVDVNTHQGKDWGETPLMEAAERCNLEVVKLLLLYGADVNERGFNNKKNALMCAVTARIPENDDDMKRRQNEVVQLLATADGAKAAIDEFYDVGVQFVGGRRLPLMFGAPLTPLMFAIAMGRVDLVQTLLELGADPFIEKNMGRESFTTMEMAGNAPENDEELIELLRIGG